MQAGGKFAPSAPALTQATGVHSMARADANPTTNLSSMIRDPFVRAAFEAAERDGLAPLAVLVDTPFVRQLHSCRVGGGAH